MATIERSGASVEAVIRDYCKEFKVREWELRYDIVTRPSSGFLGFIGKRQAKLRFHQEELHERIRLFVEKLLSEMGVGFSKIKARKEGKSVYVDVVGCSDPGFLIGKNGNMLETIQFLANRSFEADRSLDRVFVDLDGYRERREQQFLRQYMPQIRTVEKNGKAVTLPLMNPADRRVIHRYIESNKGLKTLTVGEGEKKRVVVFHAKLSEKDALKHANNNQAVPTDEAPAPEAPEKAPARPRNQRPPRIAKAPVVKAEAPAKNEPKAPLKPATEADAKAPAYKKRPRRKPQPKKESGE